MREMSIVEEKLKSMFLSHRSLIPQFLGADTLWLVLLVFIDGHIDLVTLSGLLLPFSVVLNLLLCLVSAIRKKKVKHIRLLSRLFWRFFTPWPYQSWVHSRWAVRPATIMHLQLLAVMFFRLGEGFSRAAYFF